MAELKIQYSVEAAIRELLSDRKYPERRRTFESIKRRLEGFEDKELRKHLICAGAVSLRRKSDDTEMWALRENLENDDIAWEENEK